MCENTTHGMLVQNSPILCNFIQETILDTILSFRIATQRVNDARKWHSLFTSDGQEISGAKLQSGDAMSQA